MFPHEEKLTESGRGRRRFTPLPRLALHVTPRADAPAGRHGFPADDAIRRVKWAAVDPSEVC